VDHAGKDGPFLQRGLIEQLARLESVVALINSERDYAAADWQAVQKAVPASVLRMMAGSVTDNLGTTAFNSTIGIDPDAPVALFLFAVAEQEILMQQKSVCTPLTVESRFKRAFAAAEAIFKHASGVGLMLKERYEVEALVNRRSADGCVLQNGEPQSAGRVKR